VHPKVSSILSSILLYIFDIHLHPISPSLALNFPSSAIAFFHLSSPASGNMLTYEDSRLGIVIQYPSNWENRRFGWFYNIYSAKGDIIKSRE
jgi:hypothetical protein